MKTFGYYSNSDPDKEIITKNNFNCWMDALMFWSKLKQITPGDFNNIYTIIEVK